MTKAVPLSLRLFMEGVEVPVISAQLTVQPDGPAVAAIQVVPADSALTLLPRTLVHLFYLDFAAFEDYKVEEQEWKLRQGGLSQDEELNRFVAPDGYYKLLFSGQVIGLNYSKTPVSRQLVLQCMDLSIFWDTCYQWFADYSRGDALTDKIQNFVGAGQGLFDDVAGGHKWVIGNILNSKPRSPEYQDTPGLLGGVIHLLETIGGVRYRKGTKGDFKGYNGVNDFFTIGELRFNLLGMLGAVRGDKTSTKLYAAKAFRSWLRNGMTSQGKLMSFRDILNHVNRYIFHNLYPNPCARYIAPEQKDAHMWVSVPASTWRDSDAGSALGSNLDALRFHLSVSKFKFQDALAGPAQSQEESGDDTVLIYNPDQLGEDPIKNANNGANVLANTYREIPIVERWAETLKTDDASKVLESLRKVTSYVEDGLNALGGAIQSSDMTNPDLYAIILNDRQTKGNVLKRVARALEAVNNAIAEIDKLTGKARRGTKRVKRKTTVEVGGHLFTQLILPETFFVPPPRCNVIFPDQYYQLSYSRNFMREVTRLSMKGGLGLLGGGRRGANLLSRNYFAPKIADVSGKLLFVSPTYGARILLPHEVHSGITPKFEHVSQGHRWGVKAAGASKKVQKIGYLQRLANFNFFLHRWSSRSIQVGGIFMPRIALGFPAVVIDRGVPPPHVLEVIQHELGRPLLPTQFLGKVANVNHTIDQSGGATTLVLSHCRTHRAYDDEFLGLLVQEIRKPGARYTVKIEPANLGPLRRWRRKGYVRMINLHLAGALKKDTYIREFGARVVKVKDKGASTMSLPVAESFGISTAKARSASPLFVEEDPVLTQEESGDDTILGTTLSPGAVGVSEGVLADVIDLPEVLEVTLHGAPGKAESVDIAPEDLMIPEWYSDVWRKEAPGRENHIGKDVYQPLLGTWAITDGADINAEEQDKVLQRWKAEGIERAPDGETTVRDVRAEQVTVGELVTGSIEAAVDSIGILYGMLKAKDADIHEFIERYTYRPIASLIDVMGSKDLTFNERGLVSDPDNMIEGFHSRAFGLYNTEGGLPAMRALFPGLDEKRIRTYERPSLSNAKNLTRVNPGLDPRGAAQKRVLAYQAELKVSRGLAGS